MTLTVSVKGIVESSKNPLLAIRSGWKRVGLGQIASVLNGFAFKSAQFAKEGGVPLIRIRDIGSNTTDTHYIGEFDERYMVEPGDLLIGMDGDFNCARWNGPRALLNQRVCKVSLQDGEYHPRFLDYALPAYLKAINDATSSVTVKHLSSRSIEDIPLPLPPLAEQEVIVAEVEKQFSRLDEAVSSLRRVELNLRRYCQAQIAAACPKPGVTLTSGWRWERLQNLGELARGKSRHRPRNDPKLYGGLYPFIQTAEVRASRGRIRSHSQTYNELGLAQSRLWPKGTLCITIAANIAETGILEFDACFPDSVVGLRVQGNPALARYVELYLRSVKDRLHRLAPATAQKNINLEILEQLQIPVPPEDSVEHVVATIEKGLSIADQVNVEVATGFLRANRLKKAQLTKVFSTR